MKPKMTVAIPVRNKNIQLVTNFTYSLKWNPAVKDDAVIPFFFDLGSERSYSKKLKQLVVSMPNAKYDCSFDYPEWNKPVAMNAVLRQTDTEWFAVLDADYILETHFFEKILEHMTGNWDDPFFIQCRGYDIAEDDYRDYIPETGLIQLMNHKEMKDAIYQNSWEPRPKTDYGGFQAVPTDIAKAISGYDMTFRLYGGIHHEFRNRLLNWGWGAKEHRLHGDPVLLHQPHKDWNLREDGEELREIKEERECHREIIKEIAESDTVQPEIGLDEVWDLLVEKEFGKEIPLEG